MTFAERFGRNVADARRRAGLSQEGLYFRSEVHRTVISKVERGETTPRADTLAKLAGGIGIDPGELFAGLVWEPSERHAIGRFSR
jgi:transcriptional regulator with XRE-family HTH domain